MCEKKNNSNVRTDVELSSEGLVIGNGLVFPDGVKAIALLTIHTSYIAFDSARLQCSFLELCRKVSL